MSYGIKLKVWGDYACFTRPEMKVERVSYDVMTPGAARGLLEAIYWKPEMEWIIEEIRVFRPVRFTHVRRNEINNKIASKSMNDLKSGKEPSIQVGEHRQQRASLILKDVCYGIQAKVKVRTPQQDEKGQILENPEAKHLRQFKDRASKGQYFHHPYFGTREFPVSFSLVEEFEDVSENLRSRRDFGYMLHDMEFRPDPQGKIRESNEGKKLTATPRFFRAVMEDGVIKVPPFGESRELL